MRLSPEQIALIIDELRVHDASVTLGASYAQTTWWWPGDRPVRQIIDGGVEDIAPSTEVSLRASIEAHPGVFRPLLAGPHLRALRAAWAEGDARAAGAHLAAARAAGDPDFPTPAIDLAILLRPPTPVEAAAASEALRRSAALHEYRRVVAADGRGPDVVRGGLWFADRLAAVLGESAALDHLRAGVRRYG